MAGKANNVQLRNNQSPAFCLSLLQEKIRKAKEEMNGESCTGEIHVDSNNRVVQAKSAIVEELEEHLMAAGEARAAARAQRSATDEAAELDPASAAVSAALNVLSRGGDASGRPSKLFTP